MAVKDFYKVLGVQPGATQDEIKRAYRRLAKKYHPDATGGDKGKEQRFKEISEANETLSDPKKRAEYDELRKNPFAGARAGGGGATGFSGDISDILNRLRQEVNASRAQRRAPATDAADGGFDLNDILGGFGFGGGGGGRRAPRKGGDVRAELEVDLPEAALGAQRQITIDGKSLTVKIPAGVTSGKTIRLSGQGEPGPRGGQAGDLYLEIKERPHPLFHRREPSSADIEVEVKVPVDVAILGGKASVPTLEGGTVQVTIPPGTSSGRKLRLRGKGAPSGKDARGDLYASVSIQIPERIPERAKELLREFASLTSSTKT
jgi:molecular chaperone DnaJ